MLNTKDILSTCLSGLAKTEKVSIVDKIPGITSEKFFECWHIQPYIEVNGLCKSVNLYFGFLSSFPYTLPVVYFIDEQFGYMPHVETNGKLCLMPESASFRTDNPLALVQCCLDKAVKLLETGISKSNVGDFTEEINSYWIECYHNEERPISYYLIYKSFPNATCLMDTYFWNFTLRDEKSIRQSRVMVVPKEGVDTSFKEWIEHIEGVIKQDSLFITSLSVPETPPYDFTFQDILQRVSNEERKEIIKYVNHENGGQILFKLSDFCIGGFRINKQCRLKHRNGFSRKLNPSDVLLHFEGKHQRQQRILGYVYSSKRIASRTAGFMMKEKNFIIVGLGSVGSNLVFYLSGWNSATFTLIDYDTLRTENIGRHFLGFDSLYKLKAVAMEEYLHAVRPERNVTHICSSLQELVLNSLININKSTVMFLCTGDVMTNIFVIDRVREGEISIPAFILWLEPYAIAAHMVYINPSQMQSELTLYSKDEYLLYKYNLIADDEYKHHPDKFVKKEAGCNGEYTNYSGNDITLMLSAFYPIINQLVTNPDKSTCFRWEGNIQYAKAKGISLNAPLEELKIGHVSEWNL